jgi:hypothetical protein
MQIVKNAALIIALLTFAIAIARTYLEGAGILRPMKWTVRIAFRVIVWSFWRRRRRYRLRALPTRIFTSPKR